MNIISCDLNDEDAEEELQFQKATLLFSKVNQLIHRGDLAASIKMLRLLQTFPYYRKPVLDLLVCSLYWDEQYHEAVMTGREAVVLFPECSSLYMLLGESLAKIGDSKEAEHNLMHAVHLEDNGENRRALGSFYLQQNQVKKALTHLLAAEADLPVVVSDGEPNVLAKQIQFELGTAFLLNKQWKSALERLVNAENMGYHPEEMLFYSPKNTQQLARTSFINKKIDKAVKYTVRWLIHNRRRRQKTYSLPRVAVDK